MFLGPKRIFLTPYPDLQAETRSRSQQRFHNYLESKATGVHFSTLYPPESVKPWYLKFPLDGSEIVLANRLKFNHYNLNYSLQKEHGRFTSVPVQGL